MSIKWQRNYHLTAQCNDGSLIYIDYPLTLEFHITRRMWPSNNTCQFRVYNLNLQSRKKITKDIFDYNYYRTLQLNAGYGPGPIPLIFNGNVKQAYSFRDSGSTNFITEWQGWDFAFATVTSFSNVPASGASMPKQQIVNNLVQNLVNTPNSQVQGNNAGTGLQIGYISNFPGTYPRGRVLLGSTWNILQQETNNRAFIDNGFINILQTNDTFGGGTINIDSTTGLLSPPRRTQTYLEIEILFEPNVQCGQQINLVSQDIPDYNGTYQIFGIDHQGIISGSVNGKCTTKLLLYYQFQGYNQVATQGLPKI